MKLIDPPHCNQHLDADPGIRRTTMAVALCYTGRFHLLTHCQSTCSPYPATHVQSVQRCHLSLGTRPCQDQTCHLKLNHRNHHVSFRYGQSECLIFSGALAPTVLAECLIMRLDPCRSSVPRNQIGCYREPGCNGSESSFSNLLFCFTDGEAVDLLPPFSI